MFSLLTFSLLLSTAVSPRALQEAKACYEALDYVCADQQLSIALRSIQQPTQVLEARKLDLLLAFAWRDELRMQSAVARIFELEPSFELKDFPADVRKRLEVFRPKPPKPDALAVHMGYQLQLLSPNSGDAAQWTPGGGLFMRLGRVRSARYSIEGYGEWARHYWQGSYGFRDIDVYGIGVLLNKQISFSKLKVFIGGGGGVNLQVLGIEDGYEPLRAQTSDARWGFSVTSTLGGCLPILAEVYACAHADPKLLVRVEKGQAKTSYVFPLGLGLRYEYSLGHRLE